MSLYSACPSFPATDLGDGVHPPAWVLVCARGLLFCFSRVAVYLACMSIIGGAYTTRSIMGGVKAGYMKVLKVRIISCS